jgi:hypothetical protein
MGIWDCGLRPLRAVGSVYEPEAVGAIGAYASEGMWNDSKRRDGSKGMRNSGKQMTNDK